LLFVLKRRLGWFKGVVDGGHALVGFRVQNVEHDPAAVAVRIDAVEFHEEERMPRQVAKVHWRDGATFVLRLAGKRMWKAIMLMARF